MASYKTRCDEKNGVTLVEVTGTMVLEDHLAYMKSDSSGNRTSRPLENVRQASLAGMSRGPIAKLVRKVKPLENSGVRAAYVFNKGEDLNKG